MTKPLFFDETLKNCRVRSGTTQLVEKYVSALPGVYDNKSHFVRCALEREFRRARSLCFEKGVDLE